MQKFISNKSICKMAHNKKGFTLVELLIVVAIIAILAAIAIPQFNRYVAKSKIIALNADLKNAYIAAQSYMTWNESTHITTENALLGSGYKRTAGIEVITIDIGVQTGEIVLKQTGIDPSIVDTVNGRIDFNGVITLPRLK